MQKSPFKFLDSFTKDDRDIFFGRDKEIEELYLRVFESKLLLIYGMSGTGKSSLINCGLANKFNDSDWLPVSIRRGPDINQSIIEGLYKHALTRAPFEKYGTEGKRKISLSKALQSVYLDHFKPIYLILDQLEELFIFGNTAEKEELTASIRKVLDADLQCRFIFSVREEYLAGITEFEKVIPTFFNNRMRIERMTRQNAIQAIEGPCRFSNLAVEPGFPEALLDKLNPDSPDVELTYLQVYLDKLHRLVDENRLQQISQDLLPRLGEVKDLLGSFLEEQIAQLSNPDTALAMLKSFVSVKGTRQQVTEEEIIAYVRSLGRELDHSSLQVYLQKFIALRILRDKDDYSRYELRHDSLASKIYEKITLVEKELMEIRHFLDNACINYEKREVLLGSEDLKYIAPYEDKLFLNERTEKLISQSKRELQKKRRRRQNGLIITTAILIAILSAFSIWAIRERGNAIKQERIALEQKNSAVKAMDEANLARKEALTSKLQAEENEKLALNAMSQSEQARKEALASKEIAMQQKNRAEDLSVQARQQAALAEQEKKIADEQRIKAENAEEIARKLGMLSTAQNLALKSVLLDKDPQLMGLMALEAFRLNLDNGGDVNDPVIYSALSEAYLMLDNGRHTIFKGLPAECRALTERATQILSLDLDGRLRSWSRDGKSKGSGLLSPGLALNYVALNRAGNRAVTATENAAPRLWDIRAEVPPEPTFSALPGHTGRVRAADWSSDGQSLATGGMDSLILVWDVQSGAPALVCSLKNPGAVKALAFCGKDTLATALESGSILLWNLKQQESRVLYQSNTDRPLSLAWNPVNKTLLAGLTNGNILLFSRIGVPNGQPKIFGVHASGIDLLCFSKDYSMLASACWDKTIHLYHFGKFFLEQDTRARAIELNTQGNRVLSMAFSADGKLLAGLSDKTIRLWESDAQKLADLVCPLVKRNMTRLEWEKAMGKDVPYEKTCVESP